MPRIADADLPDGRIFRNGCQEAARKIILFIRSKNCVSCASSRTLSGGAARDRHGRWERDAMDAVRARRSADCVRRNRAVPIPRRWNQALRTMRKATVANKPGTPRRTRISRKPIAQGTPVVRLPCGLLRAQCALSLHARLAGAASIRCSLRPLYRRGTMLLQSSDISCRENEQACSPATLL